MSKQHCGLSFCYIHVPRWILIACSIVALAGCHWTSLISVSSGSDQGNTASYFSSMSADGRFVAFQSSASNLVFDDTNGYSDIFVRNTVTGTTSLVSIDSEGNPGNGQNYRPAISDDGRYIAFFSYSRNLVVGDTNFLSDIYVRDTVKGITSRVSVDSAGNEGSDDSLHPSISSDGRYVAFESNASNLVAGDDNNAKDVFVHDTVTGSTSRVSVDNLGSEGNGYSRLPVISGDGRYIAFESNASNLVAGDANGLWDIFVHDTVTASTTRVSVDSAGNESTPGIGFTLGTSSGAAISADGRYVAFRSSATNLVTGDNNARADVFLHDTITGTTNRVSVDSVGNEATYPSSTPAISNDGRYIAFSSSATTLVAGDANSSSDIFVRDTVTATTSRVSVDSFGNEANDHSHSPTISGDGRYVTFSTEATNVAMGDSNGVADIVIRVIPEATIVSIFPDHLPIGATTSVTVSGSSFLPGTWSYIGNAKCTNQVIVDENTLTMDVTVLPSTVSGSRDVSLFLLGTGGGDGWGSGTVCSDCVTFF